ncbi:MAG: hypothetical protein ACRCYU_17705 [Nocardioides sp.]
MLRLTLTHLTFIGTNVDPASIEFGPQLTLVRGPSDTGKSFIVDALDFMMGASALKEIPERDGYSMVLLGLELPSGEHVTLTRAVAGGAFSLYLSDIREGPLPVADETLAPRHSPSAESNISRYLLKQVDLNDKRVRRNARGETDSLSFRNLAHLCVVDETQMQSETRPALTGNYVSKTKEISVLKLILQAEDDSTIVAVPSAQETARVSSAKIDVIDRLISEVEAKLSETAGAEQLRDQLARLNHTISEQNATMSNVWTRRAEASEGQRRAQQSLGEARSELSEVVALRNRFGLLRSQYESDLARLATIKEAGNLLGYFTAGTCPFCGAEPQHQHYNLECDGDATVFAGSVDAEIQKTESLRADLLLTIDDLGQRETLVRDSGQSAIELIGEFEQALRDIESELAPQQDDLRELVAAHSSIEKSLALYNQIADLQRMKAKIDDDVQVDGAVVSEGLNLGALREFSTELSKRLDDWGYPEAGSVRYDRAEQDIQAGDQFRSAHGKGVRAILHAAFTLGLAQYCFDRDIAHPGFVVLDSPLVTYRPPDRGDAEEVDASLPAGIVAAFYKDVQERFDGQVIIMENLDPTEPLDDETVDVVFTNRIDQGRYGFFPQRQGQVPDEGR